MKSLSNILFFLPAIAVALTLNACSEGSDGASSSDSISGPGQTGTAGSTARMIIDGDYLYAISGDTVQLFDITQPSMPNAQQQVKLTWNIQTLFAYEDYLLVGAADGIHILDNTDRAAPFEIGDFRHAMTRDPVVAQNGVAYATLRRDDSIAGNAIVNQLNVIDISDVANPTLVETESLNGPSGLAVRGERLYVCDGTAGLIIYDVSNKFDAVFRNSVNRIECSDVIATDDTLHVIGPQEYAQYSTESNSIPQLISSIKRQATIYVVDR